MRPFEVAPGERALFVFTHPDDELVLAAWIGRLVKAGTPVHLCWIHSNSIRERESRAACSLLGLQERDLTFFTAPDGRVLEELPHLRRPMETLVKTFDPTRAYVNAFEQGHIDHDATNLLVNLSFDGPVFEAPLYHTYLTKVPVLNAFSDQTGEHVIRLQPNEKKTKRMMATMYPSQTVARNLKLYTIVRLLSLRHPDLFESERCRLQTHKDFLTPNHAPALARKIESSALWKRWAAAARHLIT